MAPKQTVLQIIGFIKRTDVTNALKVRQCDLHVLR